MNDSRIQGRKDEQEGELLLPNIEHIRLVTKPPFRTLLPGLSV